VLSCYALRQARAAEPDNSPGKAPNGERTPPRSPLAFSLDLMSRSSDFVLLHTFRVKASRRVIAHRHAESTRGFWAQFSAVHRAS
jgi:hypothetical protein